MKFGNLSSIIRISKHEIFVYGGQNPNTLSVTCIIDFIKYDFKVLQAGINRFGASPSLYQDKIYVFGGGQKDFSINNSNCIDLVNQTWSSLMDLPIKIRNTSTLVINDDIIISGDGKIIYSYSINNNNYKELASNVTIQRFNILIPYNDKILMLSDYIHSRNI